MGLGGPGAGRASLRQGCDRAPSLLRLIAGFRNQSETYFGETWGQENNFLNLTVTSNRQNRDVP